jgi:CheY-like chemotaxis protein
MATETRIAGPGINMQDLDQAYSLVDAMEAVEDKSSNRKSSRCKYRKNNIVIQICQPGGGVTERLAVGRELSAGGMGLLCRGYVHVSSDCKVILHRRMGGAEEIPGTIVHCRHVRGTWHVVGIKFKSRIFPKLFLDASEWGDEPEERVTDAKHLTGNVLHLEDQELDRVLVAHWLKGDKVKVTGVDSAADALKLIAGQQFGVIVCDLNVKGGTGEAAIKAFRAAGFRGGVVVLSAETSQPRIAAAWTAGANKVLQKPCDGPTLISTVAPWLTSQEQTAVGEPNQEHAARLARDQGARHAVRERGPEHDGRAAQGDRRRQFRRRAVHLPVA